MKIGVLALQGAFFEHQRMIEKEGADTLLIKKPEQMADIDGLIIPGGESTTIGKLMIKQNLNETIIAKIKEGMPVLGTCAGMILLAKEIEDSNQYSLSVMDITVKRNAFGRQIDSFEIGIPIKNLGKKEFPAVFIRAPYIEKVGKNVNILAIYNNKIVMAEEENILAAAFHPELTEDSRIHKYFLNKVKNSKNY